MSNQYRKSTFGLLTTYILVPLHVASNYSFRIGEIGVFTAVVPSVIDFIFQYDIIIFDKEGSYSYLPKVYNTP